MTDLEQKLINELGKLAKQYAEDQKRLSGQVERLEKQVRQLDTSHEEAEKSHEEAEKRYNHWVEALLLLHKDYRAMTNHIEQLTTAYETQQSSFRSLADGFIELQRDITELAR